MYLLGSAGWLLQKVTRYKSKSPVSIQTQSRTLRKRKPQETQEPANVS